MAPPADLAHRLVTLDRDQRRSVLHDLRVRLEVNPGGVIRVTDLSLPVAC